MKFEKQNLLIVAVAILALLNIPTPAWSMTEKHVITDPDDPKFDPKEFRFENYYKNATGEKEFEYLAVMIKVFPPGTKRKFIEDIILNKNGAKRAKTEYGEEGYLWYATWWTPAGDEKQVSIRDVAENIGVIYDNNDRSIYLRVGAKRLYGNETESDKQARNNRKNLTAKDIEALDKYEDKLKVIRKKYLSSPDGYLDEINSNNQGGGHDG